MLQRIYGTAFPVQQDLDEHLKRVEEALKLQRFAESGAIEKQYQPSGKLLTSYFAEETDDEEE